MSKKICLGELNQSMKIVERSLVTPLPGTVAPRYEYVTLLQTRAKVKTRGAGSNALTELQIGDHKVSHEFTIRYTSTAFEADSRVEFAGRYFDILAVEEINEGQRWLKISCAEVGATAQPGAA